MNITVFANNQRELALQGVLFKNIDTKKNKCGKKWNINIELNTAEWETL
jgi:hypothetical protein